MGFFSKIAGQVAGAAVGSLLGGGGKKGAKQKIKPFTPANLYTPSGNATWAGGNGTATLSPELQKYQDYYGQNAGNYQGAISQFFAPQRSSYTTQMDGTQEDYNKYLTGSNSLDKGANGGRDFLYQAAKERGQLGAYYKLLADGSLNESTKTSKSSKLMLMSSTQAGMKPMSFDEWSKANKSSKFDQAGFDAANTNYVSPEQTMYDKLRALSQPAEDQARADNESRLFSQGLLGASNGQGYNPTIKAFNDSTHQADLQRELTALTSTPDLIAKWQNLQNSQSSGAQGLSQIPNELLKIGANIGVGAGTNSINAATAQSQIANTQGDFWKSASGIIGQGVTDSVDQFFSKPSDTNSPFSFKPSTNNNLGTDFNFGSLNFLK